MGGSEGTSMQSIFWKLALNQVHVLKATSFLTSLLEKMTYSMICNLFHILYCEIIGE